VFCERPLITPIAEYGCPLSAVPRAIPSIPKNMKYITSMTSPVKLKLLSQDEP